VQQFIGVAAVAGGIINYTDHLRRSALLRRDLFIWAVVILFFNQLADAAKGPLIFIICSFRDQHLSVHGMVRDLPFALDERSGPGSTMARSGVGYGAFDTAFCPCRQDDLGLCNCPRRLPVSFQ
jgi:hypothetical protein